MPLTTIEFRRRRNNALSVHFDRAKGGIASWIMQNGGKFNKAWGAYYLPGRSLDALRAYAETEGMVLRENVIDKVVTTVLWMSSQANAKEKILEATRLMFADVDRDEIEVLIASAEELAECQQKIAEIAKRNQYTARLVECRQ